MATMTTAQAITQIESDITTVWTQKYTALDGTEGANLGEDFTKIQTDVAGLKSTNDTQTSNISTNTTNISNIQTSLNGLTYTNTSGTASTGTTALQAMSTDLQSANSASSVSYTSPISG